MEDDFIELLGRLFGVDEHHRDDENIENLLYERFGIDLEQAFRFAQALLEHAPKVETGNN